MVHKRKVRAVYRKYAFTSRFETIEAKPLAETPKLTLVPIDDVALGELEEFISVVETSVRTEIPWSAVGPSADLS